MDHKLLEHPAIIDLTGGIKICAWHSLCVIKQFTLHTESRCFELREGQFSEDIGRSKKTLVKALMHLQSHGVIEMVSDWQRKGNRSRVWRYSLKDHKVWSMGPSGMVQGTRVNNTKVLLKEDTSFLDKRITSKLREEDPQRFTELVYLESLKKKQNKDR